MKKTIKKAAVTQRVTSSQKGTEKEPLRRIMYIENKGDSLEGEGRIGWVTFSKSKRSYLYKGLTLKKVRDGYKYNCIEQKTGDKYWVSGPKVRGGDRLYGGMVEIDEDAREEYWDRIRKLPERKKDKRYRC